MKNKRIVALEERRDTLNSELTKLDEAVIERGSDLTADEQTNYDEMTTELDQVNTDLGRLIKRENDMKASVALGASLGSAVDKNNGKLGGKDEEEDGIYRADANFNFVQDLFNARQGNHDAAERLTVHRAASASSDLPGIIVPTYLVDRYIALAIQRGRPFLNTLVDTLSYRGTINEMAAILPRETADADVDAQSSQNSAFATAQWTTEELSIPTLTVGGYIDISIQAATFGNLNDRLFGELLVRHMNRMDYLALHGTGANGQPEGLFEADGTQVVDADTVSGFAEHIAVANEAASKIETTDFREAQYLLMSPGRWRALLSATESTGRPLAGFNGSFPMNVGAFQDASGQKWFAGMKVVTDQNVVKSGEDDTFMAVYNTDAFYFAETEPKKITADQVIAHTGGVRFVSYGFWQFSPEVRVNSLCIIQDLTPPEFPTLAVS